MPKFKPPKVIYTKDSSSYSGTWYSERYKDICSYKYVLINNNWLPKFKKKFPMLANDTAGVIGFIKKEVLGG